MQERQVTAGGKRHALPDPFFVLATQNPIEQEGTYPLPEAQLDRFLFKIFVGYPDRREERRIYRLTTGDDARRADAGARRRGNARACSESSAACRSATTASTTSMARPGDPARRTDAPQFIGDWVLWGVGPRGGQSLILAAKARAALDGRPRSTSTTSRRWPPPVLRHRIVLNYNAESQGQTSETVIERRSRRLASTTSRPAFANVSRV